MNSRFHLLLNNFNCTITCIRTLINDRVLRVNDFMKKRDKEASTEYADNFKSKLRKKNDDPNMLVLTHDVKKMCYMVKTEDDLSLFKQLLIRHCSDKSLSNTTRFQSFTVGTEIMRLLYLMNKPVEAMSLIKDKCTSSLFSDFKSYLILQNLLYINKMYNEVCQIFHIVQDKQLKGQMFPIFHYVLFQAACYKLNTSESYNDVMKCFDQYIKFCNKPMWPSVLYTTMCALSHGSPELPLKYAQGNDPASVNIKLTALIMAGDISGAIDYFGMFRNKSIFIKSVAEELFKKIENLTADGKKEAIIESYKNLKDKLRVEDFKDETLDELAANVINSMTMRSTAWS